MTLSQTISSSTYKQSCIQEYVELFSSTHTVDQQARAIQDIESIFQNFLTSNYIKAMEATLVIGPKGSGKTWFSTYEVESKAAWGSNLVYLSSDYLCHNAFKNTFLKDKEKQSHEALLFWKPLGDLIVKFLQKEALMNKCSIVVEADPTDPSLELMLRTVKAYCYSIKVIHLTAPEDIRRKCLDEPLSKEEDEKFYEGAQLFSSNTTSSYLEAADEVEFYLRNRLDTKPMLAATWVKSKSSKPVKGTLHVFDESLLNGISRVHDLSLRYLAEIKGFASFTSWRDLLDQHCIETNNKLKKN